MDTLNNDHNYNMRCVFNYKKNFRLNKDRLLVIVIFLLYNWSNNINILDVAIPQNLNFQNEVLTT